MRECTSKNSATNGAEALEPCQLNIDMRLFFCHNQPCYCPETAGRASVMKTSFWKRLETALRNRLSRRVADYLDRVITILRIPAPGTPQLIQRITVMERDFVLPIKAAGIAMLLYSFFFSSSSWMNHVLGELEIAVESTQYIFGIYIIINIAFAALLL